MGERLRQQVVEHASVDDLKATARKHVMRTTCTAGPELASPAALAVVSRRA